MNNLTSLETILIIYIIVVNFLGIVAIIMNGYAPKKASDIIFGIMLLVAIPITLPIVLCQMLFDKLKRKRKQDLDKQFDDFFEEEESKEKE